MSQNVVDLFVGAMIVLELRDTMFKLGSSSGLSAVAIEMWTPMAAVRVECKYLYLFPERVWDVDVQEYTCVMSPVSCRIWSETTSWNHLHLTVG